MPTRGDVFIVQTNASGQGIGGVLNITRKELLPAGFFSSQLSKAEKNYSAMELEGLAVVCMMILHFAHYLYGEQFTVVTDHKALCSFRSSRVLNRQLQFWALCLQDFDFQIYYRRGKENENADGLSRQAAEDEINQDRLDFPDKLQEPEGRSQLSMGGCGAQPTA